MASEEEAWAYTTDQEDFDDFFSPEPDLEGALAPWTFMQEGASGLPIW